MWSQAYWQWEDLEVLILLSSSIIFSFLYPSCPYSFFYALLFQFAVYHNANIYHFEYLLCAVTVYIFSSFLQ